MPALLLFSAERIRGLQGRLICQGAHAATDTQPRTQTQSQYKKANMSAEAQKSQRSMHVSTDSNTTVGICNVWHVKTKAL